MNHRLQITSVEPLSQQKPFLSSKNARRQETQAAMERLWLVDPQQFDPDRDAVQKKRIANTLSALKKKSSLHNKRCVDLGCGSGKLSFLMQNEGAKIDAVDVASQALDRIKAKNLQGITPIQDCLPSTLLEDDAYDLVVCAETIGYLNAKEYRMLFAELSRLVKKEGFVLCSTSLDFKTDDALERFAALAETEFEIEEWVLRYDLLWTLFCRFFEAPENFWKMSKNEFERKKQLNKKKLIGRTLFRINTSKPFVFFWKLVSFVSTPLARQWRQSARLVDFFEKTTRFLWDESGITHALFIGKRRPLISPLPANEIPVEMKHKRQVWE